MCFTIDKQNLLNFEVVYLNLKNYDKIGKVRCV